MKIKEWYQWLKSLHYTQKWFVILILLRPIIDNFYYLKAISPLVSPLYIVGVLTPILCLWSISKIKNYYRSPIDGIFGAWIVIVMLNFFFVFLYNLTDIKAYETFFQYIIFFVIYYFSRRMIKTEKDLDGIFTTFLLASVTVVIILLYEIFINPLKTIQTRGMQRLEGAYADVMNYGIYITQSILIACFFMIRKNISLSRSARMRLLIICLSFGLVALVRIVHLSSITVSLTIIGIFLLIYFQRNVVQATLLVITALILALNYGKDVYEERIFPLVGADIAVYQGEREEEQAFHGRMSRWERMWDEFSSQPIYSQFLGITLSVHDKPYKFMTAGTHNDYLRILFSSGYIGFILYIFFLINLLLRIRVLTQAYKYLLFCALATILLYSVSTGPTLYSALLYNLCPIFAFSLLPEKVTRQYS